ncbi:MAG: substrate-binding domain-containing protein [Lentisphaerae bacterium]|nr:substrate-binding domain-containing protein [Lentisphaerota bacterium]
MALKTQRDRIFDIAVVINLIGASGRNLLAGVSRYARENCHWRIHLFKNGGEFSAKVLADIEVTGLDGLIISDDPAPVVRERIKEIGIPVVVIGMGGVWFDGRLDAICSVRNDDEDIGRFGAKFFSSLGRFRSYGYVPCLDRRYWSLLREKGFRSQLRRVKDSDVRVFRHSPDTGAKKDQDELSAWLTSLPKPAAVMAAYDDRATNVIEAAARAGIAMPENLNVIGVDNDELLCDFTSPMLTSIMPDHEALGACAAAQLERLLARTRKPMARTVLVRQKKIVERESTGATTASAHIIERALAFIAQNARRDITPVDVVKHLRISRRLADLRFHEQYGTTLAAAIGKARLEHVAIELRATEWPIKRIASSLEFGNVNSLRNRFKARYGMSMRAWRRGHHGAKLRLIRGL